MLPSHKRYGLLALISALLLGGLLSPLIKIGVKEINPQTYTLLRFLISGLLLLPLLFKDRIRLDKNIFKLIGVSVFATGNVLLFAYGIKYTSASVGQTLYILVPIFVAIINLLFFRNKVSGRKLIGILVGLIGGISLITLPLIEKTSSANYLLGNLLIVGAVLSFSFYTVFSKSLQKIYSPIHITMVFSFTTIAILLIPSATSLVSSVNSFAHLSTASILSLFYVGALGTAAYYILYQFGIKKMGTTTTSTVIFYLQPAITVVFSFILLKEVLTLNFIIGATIAAVGAWLVIRD